MRKISSYDADNCANALPDTDCHCRCGGRLHGKSHKALQDFEVALLEKGEEITERRIALFLNKSTKTNNK